MPSPKTDFLTVPVTRGTLEGILAEQGTINSTRNIVVASQCEWTQRILRLIPEGEWVEEGDIVVELDSSELQERLKHKEIDVIQAEAELASAKEIAQLQELENQSTIASAKLACILAELDLKRYEEGEFPRLQKEAQAALALAAEDVTRAHEKFRFIVRMAQRGYESLLTVESERLNRLKYENARRNAQSELEVLSAYTYPRQIAELRGNVRTTAQELARAEKQAELALVSKRILVQNREYALQRHKAYAERLHKSIEACTIRSPRTGEIVYANEGTIRNEITEGQMVRYRQEVVRLPDLERLQVDVRIHETEINGVAAGLPAIVTIDAFPGLILTGRISSVSRVPTSTGSYYTRDLKEYDASIVLDLPEDHSYLKPGLTANVGIELGRRNNCLSIPPQSIVDIGGRPMAFVTKDGKVVHRELELGLVTDTGVEVISGLQEDERVLLSPRTTCGPQIVALTEYYSSDVQVANVGG